MNMSFDPDCLTLAEHFLDDDPREFTDADYADLAATIQIAIEDWFASKDDKPDILGAVIREQEA